MTTMMMTRRSRNTSIESRPGKELCSQLTLVDRVPGCRISQIGLRSHQKQRPYPLERLQVVERVKRRRLVIVWGRSVVGNPAVLDILESMRLQQRNVLVRRSHMHRHFQLRHPLEGIGIVFVEIDEDEEPS